MDRLVFVDDAHYITQGWIDRNHIALHGVRQQFKIPLIGASHNWLIHEIAVGTDEKWRRTLARTVEKGYRQAPWFEGVIPGFRNLIETADRSIGELVKRSIRWACD